MCDHVDYSSAFWTEDQMIRQREAFMNVLMNPGQFPKANAEKLWRDVDELEFAMIQYHPTVRVMRVLTGAA